MVALSLWRYTSGRVLGGWGPLLCVLLGSLVGLLMPLVGVDDQCCAALKGIAHLRCQLWGSHPAPTAVQSTSLTIPFTALDLLPQRSKPSKGRVMTYYSIMYVRQYVRQCSVVVLLLACCSLLIHQTNSLSCGNGQQKFEYIRFSELSWLVVYPYICVICFLFL